MDLELRFGLPSVPRLLVWVEVKHGAQLGNDQLARYEADILLEPAEVRQLVYLAPPGTKVPEVPVGVYATDWQRVGLSVSKTHRRGQLDDVGGWLANEFVKYLREEGLAEDRPLATEHALAFGKVMAAERIVSELLKNAKAVVDSDWGEPAKGSEGFWMGFNATHAVARAGETPAATWDGAEFEWSFRLDKAHPEPRDCRVFIVGATGPATANPAKRTGNEAWNEKLASAGFYLGSDQQWRLCRYLYAEDLLSERSVEGQADVLAQFVLDGFGYLAEHPPPV